MNRVQILPQEQMGNHFEPYLKFRDKQTKKPVEGWRNLHSDELERLVKNNNTAQNWDDVLVSDPFEPKMLKNNKFFGLVRIGAVRSVVLQHHDLRLPAGITNSLIISCDIGDDVAIHDVHYLSHYIIGDQSILFNIQEMNTTDHAKFGNGIVKEGEPESVRTWLEVMNETACRRVLPFDGMLSADAYLWAKYIDDAPLQENLLRITQSGMDARRGYFGVTGSHCVVKNSSIIKDVKIGSHCYIKGANKLKNLTINSSEAEPSQIGEGVVLVNGIVGYGCHIFYSCTAVRFVLGDNSSLKYGARLINSFLGDNSTISCCEVLNNLIFPAHEQHHNNSFLVAALVMGQSNMAAGATMGSNHNSRSNDNEIQAGRGFWPGLCTSVKHSCRFASFVLLSKSDYPAEMDIPLPFSLLNNNVSQDRLEVMPAFWWMYNMYALERNTWKYSVRDKRSRKLQHIEFDSFAPDTAEEMIHALVLLERWTAQAYLRKNGLITEMYTDEELRELGRKLLMGPKHDTDVLQVLGEKMEKSKRKVVILKPRQAWFAYREMLMHYAMNQLIQIKTSENITSCARMHERLNSIRETEWVNMGGQLMKASDVNQLREDIGTGRLNCWSEIHQRYDALWERYPLDKQQHAYAIWRELMQAEAMTPDLWIQSIDEAERIRRFVVDQVYDSRRKDYENGFRKITFRNEAEMEAAIGRLDENSFIIKVKSDLEDFLAQSNDLKQMNT
jgi:hypothetical protein